MRPSRFICLCLVGILITPGAIASAETESETIQRLEKQLQELLGAQQRLQEQQTLNEKELADLREKLRAVMERKPTPAPPGAPESFRFYGDVDFRFDLIDHGSRQTGLIPEEAEGTLRERVRLNLRSPLFHRSEAVVQLSSGLSPSPTSPYVTLGDAFRGKDVRFGRFYLAYHFGDPSDLNEPLLLVGKIDNPVWRAQTGDWASEIVWDNDVAPEGAALRVPLSRKGARVSITDTLGGYLVNFVPDQRFTGITTDTYNITNQLRVDAGRFKGAVSYLFYDHLNSGLHTPLFTPGEGIDPTPPADAFLLRSGLQNTNNRYSFGPNASGFGDDQFHILNLTGQYLFKLRSGKLQPFLVGEYLHNFSVDVDRDGYGITAGVTRGTGRRGAYTAWATYRDVDADATLATFTDSDLGAGTDYRGYQIGLTYWLKANLLGRLAFHDFDGSPRKSNKIRRLFVDLIRTF
jgi:Putative porin